MHPCFYFFVRSIEFIAWWVQNYIVSSSCFMDDIFHGFFKYCRLEQFILLLLKNLSNSHIFMLSHIFVDHLFDVFLNI